MTIGCHLPIQNGRQCAKPVINHTMKTQTTLTKLFTLTKSKRQIMPDKTYI